MEQNTKKNSLYDMFLIIGASIVAMLLCFLLLSILCGCTMSFQNIATHGKASDIVDESQTAQPDISAEVPISTVPGVI